MDTYLIRHTRINVESGICYGQSDVDLCSSFPEESKKVLSKLPVSVEDSVIYSSPLRRCYKLAKELTDEKVQCDDRLKELDFGDWELEKWEEIETEKLQEWMDDFVNVNCPGGESYLELTERVTEWWEETIKKDHEPVVVITHAGVIRSLLSYVLEIPYKNSFRLIIDPGSISAISVSGRRYSVKYINR